MSLTVFLMVLGAALVHATWNALVKADGDRWSLIGVMAGTQFVLSAALLPFFPIPAAVAWPYIAANTVLTTGYTLLLVRAYRHGDLSLVYPLARGISPLIVAGVMVFFMGERLTWTAQIGVLTVGLAVTSLALTRGASGLRDLPSVAIALATGCFIATYTIVDGLGARAAQSASGYMIWITILSSAVIVAFVLFRRRRSVAPIGQRTRRAGIASALLSYASSWIVIVALTLAPVPMVSALRETGIVFAVLIGVVFLHERLSLARFASILATLAGATLLKVSR
ncbi:MAG TPA: DMT family transporter [Reyranella sp.]|nr:DMT family transporter [Reyranella sp.]